MTCVCGHVRGDHDGIGKCHFSSRDDDYNLLVCVCDDYQEDQ